MMPPQHDRSNGEPPHWVEGWMRGYTGWDEWLDRGQFLECCTVAGCWPLLTAILIFTAFALGVWCGGYWSK
jgi:hypothetical protein